MSIKTKILIISVIIIGCFNINKLEAQVVYLHKNDSVFIFHDSTIIPQYIYNEELLNDISSMESTSIWMLNLDTCAVNKVAGIPFCDTCMVGANLILQTAYKFSYMDKKVIQGSCWDYANAIYSKLNSDYFKKHDIFFSKKAGPYAPISMLQPGDWIYHVNHQFYGVEHSAIFICWKDYEEGIAITLSYMGMNKWKTAEFGEFDLKSVYAIFRMQDELW